MSKDSTTLSDSASVQEITTDSKRYNAAGKRRGRVHYAAPLGFVMLLLATVGLVFLLVSGIKAINKWGEQTELREELYTFLNPVMQFSPAAFDSAADTAQDSLLLAAIYRVSEAERIRQLREKDDNCAYPLEEEQWRMQIPRHVIEESFATLFGSDIPLTHRTVAEVEYAEAKGCYLVPLTIKTSGYTPVIDTIKHKKDLYTVRVAYVANADVEVDEKGNAIFPTADMAKYAQLYTVQRQKDDSWILKAVSAEETQ